MARVTHVAKAQQRYETVPVLDENGQPKRTPVMADGVQKVSKRGPVYMTVTVADRSKPLAPYDCDFCNKPIEVGTAYKHISPKSGPYGGRKLTRHEGCPTWNVWEYNSSNASRVAQIQHDARQSIEQGIAEESDFESVRDEIVESIREFAAEKQEGADNIESGFGNSTSQSEELADLAQNLESWADEVEQAEAPEWPEPEEEDCEHCNGTGEEPADSDVEVVEFDGPVDIEQGGDEGDDGEEVIDPEPCSVCEGACVVTPDEPDDEAVQAWIEEAQTALQDAVDNCPV